MFNCTACTDAALYLLMLYHGLCCKIFDKQYSGPSTIAAEQLHLLNMAVKISHEALNFAGVLRKVVEQLTKLIPRSKNNTLH